MSFFLSHRESDSRLRSGEPVSCRRSGSRAWSTADVEPCLASLHTPAPPAWRFEAPAGHPGGVVSVVVVGLEHQRTPLDVLERRPFSSTIFRRRSLHCVTVPTFSRSSSFRPASEPSSTRWSSDSTRVWRTFRSISPRRSGTTVEQLSEQLTVHFDDAVVVHLFEVAAGLRSAVPGEHEVLGQVRLAAKRAEADRAAGPVLAGLFDSAVQAGRRVRSETSIGRGTTSLVAPVGRPCGRASRPARFGSAKVVVVGAGQMSKGVVAALRSRGIDGSDVSVVNRTHERADRARPDGGRESSRARIADGRSGGGRLRDRHYRCARSCGRPRDSRDGPSGSRRSPPRPARDRRPERAAERRSLGGRARRRRAARHRGVCAALPTARSQDEGASSSRRSRS